MLRKAFAAVLVLVLALALAPIAYADTGVIGNYDDTYAQYSDGDADTAAKRDEHGQVSWLNTESNNPYHNLIALKIDLGAEFATYPGDDRSEGFIVKCRPGDTIKLPVVRAKPGYTFVGWSQGGVPDEIEWGIFTTEVDMTQNAGNGGQTSLYAVYMDEEGNGFCTCGAYKKGAYKDDMERFQREYSEYLAENRGASTGLDLTGILIAVVAAVLALIVGYLVGKRKKTEKVQIVEAESATAVEFNADPDLDHKSDSSVAASSDIPLEDKIKLV